jgi:hypothetical protein
MGSYSCSYNNRVDDYRNCHAKTSVETASWTEQEVDRLTAAVLRLPGASRWHRKTSMNELKLAMRVLQVAL